MRHALGLAGLAGAVAFALVGAALLVRPAEASHPAVADQVASPAPLLVPPEDPAIRPYPELAGATPTSDSLAVGTRVLVPRLHIDVALELGDLARDVEAQTTPAAGAYLLPGSAVPGTVGNAYVYAHARPGLFLALWNARLGDVVEVVEPSGSTVRYAVTEIHPRVDPTDGRYLASTGDERLTLQTSTGPWVLSPRFVVVARPLP